MALFNKTVIYVIFIT